VPEDLDLATIDYAIMVGYVVMILGIGYWVSRKKSDSEGFFLAERGQIWPLVGFGLIAANFSGTQYLGLAGAGYSEGIAVWNYEWMAALVLVVFAVLILPFSIQTKIQTMPEFLGKRDDQRSRKAFSGFTVFTAVLIDSAGALFAGALVLHLLFPDIPLMVHIVGIALLGGIYVILGGLQAVMITDTVQGVLLFAAGGAVFGSSCTTCSSSTAPGSCW
jgi:solute:Na+ symporter, SSS family